MINTKTALRSAIVAATLAPSLTMAAGYKLNEQSAAGMGTAHAGRAAMAEDASVVFYNPAALTELDRAQLTAGFTYINGTGEFTGNATNAGGEDITGADDADPYNNGGNYLGEAAIPFFYYAQPINEKFAVGLGIFTPFGTNTDYDENFVGGGFADETSLKSIEIAPTFAYKINDQLSIGGGIDIIYMDGLLSKSVDSVPYSSLVNGLAGETVVLGQTQYRGFESHYEVSGDDWGYGWNLGVYYKLSEATTLGFAYRSEIDITLKGDSTFKDNELAVYSDGGTSVNPADASTLADDSVTVFSVAPQASEVPLTTPASATLSVTHQATDTLLLQAGATWTGWSSFQNFDVIATERATPSMLDGLDISDIAFDSGDGLDAGYIGHIDERWVDVWAVAVGGTYQLNNKLALRAGYAFDESPVRDEFRTARVPSSDRQWLTLGAGYAVSADLTVDVAAGYLYMERMTLDERNKKNDNTFTDSLTSVNGAYEIDVFGLSAQVNYKF